MLKISMPSRMVVQCGLAAVASIIILSWLHIRPLGILFLVVFSFWFYKTRCNLRIIPPPELKTKYEQINEHMRNLRRTNPVMFCVICSGCLGSLAILGHLISGSAVVVLGLVLVAIMSTKYNFKFVKIQQKDFAWAEKLNHDPEFDDEFMPEVNESNLCVLESASNLTSFSSPTDDAEADEEKSDEIPSELLIPDSIPEIDENYTDGDEDDDDLVPIVQRNVKAATNTNITKISNAANARDDEIEFKRGHFKRDSSLSTTSSSSDEESLSKGLKFPDHTTVDAGVRQRQLLPPPPNADASDLVALAVRSQTQTLLANSGKLLPSLMSGLVQWGMGNVAPEASTTLASRRVVTALDSSDESDFEILENDDFK